MQKINLVILANNCPWLKDEHLKELKKWFASKTDLQIKVVETYHTNVPFTFYGIEGYYGVDRVWYDKNITNTILKTHQNTDIVLFLVDSKDWKGGRARGWRADADNGIVELQVASTENEGIWVKGAYMGSTFFNYARHEILHALFMLTGQTDTTHFHWDRWQLENALAEINFDLEKSKLMLFIYNHLRNFSIALQSKKNPVPPLEGEVKTPPPTKKSRIVDWAKAIEKMEGYYKGSRSYRNNNSGNLKASKFAIGKDSGGFCIFKDYQAGFNALIYQLQLATHTTPDGKKSAVYNPDMSLWKFCQLYAPSHDNNNPDVYAANVAKMLGVKVDIKIRELA